MAFEHYDKCSLLLPMDGANNGTTFTDWSLNPKTVTVNGDAKTVTAESKYYGSSGYFDGSGDYLEIPASTDFEFGSEEFTISAWINIKTSKTTAGLNNTILSKDATLSTRGWNFSQNGDNSGKLLFVFRDGTTAYVVMSNTVPVIDTWYHVAIVRKPASLELYVNGVLENSTDVTGVGLNANSTYKQYVGTNCASVNTPILTSSAVFDGYIQDLIVVKSAALWTANFTPPARLIGELSGNVTDETNSPVERRIFAVPRCYPTRLFTTISDSTTGDYTLRVPATEVSRIALADSATLYNDIVDRIIPE